MYAKYSLNYIIIKIRPSSIIPAVLAVKQQ